jgi:hypothetical protein
MPRFLPSILALGIPLGCTSVLGLDGNYVLGTEEAGLVGAGGSTGGNGEAGGTESGGTAGSSSGGRNSGGTLAGGGVATGGATTGGNAGSPGGAASCDSDGASCPSGQKCCQVPDAGVKGCVDPLPIVGCEAADCTPCPAPPQDGIPICVSGQCDFECSNGTTRKGNACESSGAGGGGGAGGGTGGAPPTPPCEMPSCRGCGLIGPFHCCRADKSCGCTYAPGAVCY